MKSDSLMSLLVAVLFANAAATALLSFHYVRSVAAQQRLAPLLARDQAAYAAFRSLSNETLEYGKTNLSIGPLLQEFGVKINPSGISASPGALATNKPPIR